MAYSMGMRTTEHVQVDGPSAERAAVAAQLAVDPTDRAGMLRVLGDLAAADFRSREVALGHLAEYRAGVPALAARDRIRACWAAPPPEEELNWALAVLRAAGLQPDERFARHCLLDDARSVACAAASACPESEWPAARAALGAGAERG